MNINKELKRLESILLHIDSARRFEHAFDKIYNLLVAEYPLLNPDKDYEFKAARVYRYEREKRPSNKEANANNYEEFLSDFRALIMDKIIRIKMTGNHTVEQ